MMQALIIPFSDGCEALGVSSSTGYEQARDGLLPPPFKAAKRLSALLASEIEAVAVARARGDSDEKIRELVRQLVAARQAGAEGADHA